MADILKEQHNKKYNDYVKQVTPVHSLPANMAKAFVTGGAICVIGQAILNICEDMGLDRDASAGWCSILLILASVLLTGLNLYPKLAKFGGAGTLVPITGFANSVAAPAIEFHKDVNAIIRPSQKSQSFSGEYDDSIQKFCTKRELTG